MEKWKNKILVFIAVILAIIAPLIFTKMSNYMVYMIGMVYLYMIWATGMNLTYGFTGILPLMYAGLAGIGAYVSAFMVMKLGLSFWLALPVSGLVAALSGVLLGLPSLRLRGFFFTLSSMVIQVALTLIFTQWRSFTGGDTGISNIIHPHILLPNQTKFVIEGVYFVYLILILLFLTILLVNWILKSDLGKKFIAIREDDTLAITLGINVTRYKIISFAISSFIAGLGGSLYAHYVSFVNPSVFNITTSLNIWLLIMFGGKGSIMGPLIGTLALTPIPYVLRKIYPFRDVIYGSIVVITAMFLPRGVYGEISSLLRKKSMTNKTTCNEEEITNASRD